MRLSSVEIVQRMRVMRRVLLVTGAGEGGAAGA